MTTLRIFAPPATHDTLGLIEALLAQLDAPPSSRTNRLVRASTSKKARKLVEEAAEVALDAVSGDRDGLIAESVGLLYHLKVVWHHRGVAPEAIRHEMTRRAEVLGIVEKLPKRGPKKRAWRKAAAAKPCAAPTVQRRRLSYRDGDMIVAVPLSRAAAR